MPSTHGVLQLLQCWPSSQRLRVSEELFNPHMACVSAGDVPSNIYIVGLTWECWFSSNTLEQISLIPSFCPSELCVLCLLELEWAVYMNARSIFPVLVMYFCFAETDQLRVCLRLCVSFWPGLRWKGWLCKGGPVSLLPQWSSVQTWGQHQGGLQ